MRHSLNKSDVEQGIRDQRVFVVVTSHSTQPESCLMVCKPTVITRGDVQVVQCTSISHL